MRGSNWVESKDGDRITGINVETAGRKLIAYIEDRWGSNWVPRHEKLITILSQPYNPAKVDLPTLNYIETKKDEVVTYINSICEKFIKAEVSQERLRFYLSEIREDLEFLQDIMLNNYKEME